MPNTVKTFYVDDRNATLWIRCPTIPDSFENKILGPRKQSPLVNIVRT